MRAGEVVRRTVLGLAGGMAATAAAALLDATWSESAAGASRPAFSDAFLACFGIISPIGLAVSFAIALAFTWLSPTEPPSVASWIGELRRFGEKRQADVAALAPLVVFGTFVWTTAAAHVARIVLSLAVAPRFAGLAITMCVAALAVLVAVLVLALVPPLRRALAIFGETRPAALDPALTGGTAALVVLALFVLGMRLGTVSGEGGFLGIYGIFKRAELDLRAPIQLLAIASGALFSPNVARPPRSPSWVSLVLLAALALAPLGLLIRAAHALESSAPLSLAIERGAPLGKMLLPTLRKATDRDHDGASGLFGGGDCDDSNPAIHPAAEEILDNGVDEDCSGADLTRRAVDSLAPAPAADAVDDKLVPPDLNVVLISVDTLRADLGFAGYQRPISPNIDALAARSTVFEHAYSLASYTGKSIGPMLIGKYGSETHRNWGHFNKFDENDTFVAERLVKGGVHTMAVHAHRYFDDFGGLDRGFELKDFSAAPPKDAAWDVDTKATSQELSDAALSILSKDENTKGRFFMWIHYLDPHADYLRHEGIDFGGGARDLYDGEIAFTDKNIGRLLDAIIAAPWGKRTAIILTSDHGEAFGEHDMFRHGFEVWEPLIHVPLVVYVPGAKAHRIAERRSAVDLVPTILELMHVAPPAPDASTNDFLSGQSLLPDVFLPDGKAAAKRDILVDMPAGPYNDARRALIHDDLKLIVSGDARMSLFDLAADPTESQDLSESAPEKLNAMKERYAAVKSRLHEIKVTGKRK
ncbi:MAG TPA: sulfatase-like hydrolase/transferase [Polyangiaceae bacterium]|nr:sulfatase-like hydrolase/transferase [Polyangiaceae bacterium]